MSRASGRNFLDLADERQRRRHARGIERRFRRIFLAMHPDKNRSAVVDNTFKLLHEAWKALSARHPRAPSAAAAEGVKPCSTQTTSPEEEEGWPPG